VGVLLARLPFPNFNPPKFSKKAYLSVSSDFLLKTMLPAETTGWHFLFLM
jgi:hypothetical protein